MCFAIDADMKFAKVVAHVITIKRMKMKKIQIKSKKDGNAGSRGETFSSYLMERTARTGGNISKT